MSTVDSEMAEGWSRRARLGILAGGAAVLVALWWSGVLGELVRGDRIRDLVRQAGAAAPLAFIAIQMPLNLFFLAGAPVWIAATLWPLPLAIAYSIAGTVAASTSTYLLARYFGRRWAGARIPRRLRRFERRLERSPLRTVATLRLLLWLNPGVDLLMATARVSPRDYLIGTLLGMALPTALRVAIGEAGIEALGALASDAEHFDWRWLIAVVVATVLVIALRRRRVARLAADDIEELPDDEDLGLATDEH